MDIYSTAVIAGVVDSLKRPQSFLLDRFFPNVVKSDDEFVVIDIDDGKRRVSPLVSPLSEGQIVEGRGFRSQQIKPAYVKDKRRLDPTKPLKRAIGERIGGDLTAQAREQANLAFELEDQIEMLTRRLEVMAADGLIDGKLTLEILGVGTVEVDFGRASGLTQALTTTARWGESGVSPFKDVETWSRNVLKESGATVTDVVFGLDAWDLYAADPKVEKILDWQRGGASTIEMGSQVKAGAQFKGNNGDFNLWLYNDWYVDPADDTEKPILDSHGVILGSEKIEGTRAFGAILDPKAAFQPREFYPKSWVEEDPPHRLLMMQSAPIVIPSRVNASAYTKVR